MNKRKTYQAVLVGLTLILTGAGIGYSINDGLRNEEITDLKEPETEQAPVAAEESFTVSTVNIFSCGHILERQEGETTTTSKLEETMQRYGGYNFEVKDGVMALYREYEYCCPEHFYTTAEDNAIAVYQTDPETLEKREICRLEIKPEHPAYAELSSGMTFGSLEDINLYIEGVDE